MNGKELLNKLKKGEHLTTDELKNLTNILGGLYNVLKSIKNPDWSLFLKDIKLHYYRCEDILEERKKS